MLQGHDRHQGGDRRNEKTADKVARQDLRLGRMPPSPFRRLNYPKAFSVKRPLLRRPPFLAFRRRPKTLGRIGRLPAVAVSCRSQCLRLHIR